MKNQYRKVKKYLALLDEKRWRDVRRIEGITTCPCGYKEGHTPPPASEFSPFSYGGWWGSGTDSHAWFHFTLDGLGEGKYLHVDTDKNGWNVNNPQFIVYVDGERRQAFDTNHREVYIGGKPTATFICTPTRARRQREPLCMLTSAH